MTVSSNSGAVKADDELVDFKDPQFAYTLAKGMKILEAFSGAVAILGNKEFCEATNLGKSTVSRLSRTLVHMGYLQPVADRKYQLGPAVLSLAYPLLANMPIRRHAHIPLQELAAAVKGVVTLGLRDRTDLVFIESCRSVDIAPSKPEIGARRGLATTIPGQIYLASLPRQICKTVMGSLQFSSRADEEALLAALDRRRKELKMNGYWFSTFRGLNTVSAAVKSPGQKEIFLLNCVVEDSKMDKTQTRAKVPPMVFNVVARIEEALGVEASI